MFAASVNARSVIVLTCTATAMLTAWIIAAAPVVREDEGRVRIVVGQVRPMGDGTVRSWVRVDAHERPTAVGVTFTEAALQNLPPTVTTPGECVAQDFRLALPAEICVRPFARIVIDWMPGRGQATGQLRFRFCDDPSERAASVSDADETSFSPTLAFGSRDGQLTSIDPVIAKSHLDAHSDETLSVKLPQNCSVIAAYAPAQCRVKFDQATREYTVSLDGLTKR